MNTLFDKDEIFRWKEYWNNFPEFSQDDLKVFKQLIVSFATEEDFRDFVKLINSKIKYSTKSIWFPHRENHNAIDYLWVSEKKIIPQYPIYIISLGRWESRLTSKCLEKMDIDYKICIEPKEYEQYAAVINPNKILVLPENFSETRKSGGIPVRNWVWEHAIQSGAKKHWILDDNIRDFRHLNYNRRYRINSGAVFKIIEDFCDQFENIGMAGMDYMYFANEKVSKEPFLLNTRIYSHILIDNSLDFRWRGKYNEDTDLSLRVLKSGLCTVLFKYILSDKQSTLTMKGGNTDSVYAGTDKRKEFAESLIEQHPDVAKIVWRFNRWHHEVDYSRFMKFNKLIRKSDEIQTFDYGLKLIRVNNID
jgi:hypothetical protein